MSLIYKIFNNNFTQLLILFCLKSLFYFHYISYLGLKPQILRAESGIWFLANYVNDHDFNTLLKESIISPHNGNFTPIPFLLEIVCMRALGISDFLHLVRASLILAFLSTTIFILLRIIKNVQSSKIISLTSLSLIILSTSVVFNPITCHMVTWPFMIFQFLSVSVFILTLSCYLLYTRSNDSKHLYIGLILGYSTMHLFGIGLAFCLSTFLFFLYHYCKSDNYNKKSNICFCVVFILMVLHAFIMVSENGSSNKYYINESVQRFLYVYTEYFKVCSEYFFIPKSIDLPKINISPKRTIFDISIFVLLFVTPLIYFFKNKFKIVNLLSVTYTLLVFMIVFRLKNEQNHDVLIGYFLGDRYIFFPLIFFNIILLSLIIKNKLFLYLFSFLVFYLCYFNTVFFDNVATKIWPNKYISHEDEWNILNVNFINDLKNSQTVNNPSIKHLTEFDMRLSNLQDILIHKHKIDQSINWNPSGSNF